MVTIDLNVLNHLGINLYSNIPAVLSEVVANSWDADATEVDILIGDDSITIKDNGCGMTKKEINKKYLTVGYQKRIKGESLTPSGRPVMGRKGIGKLSLFSIANTIEVTSCKDGNKAGCILEVDGIRKATETGDDYFPKAISPECIDTDRNGTTITIRDLKSEFNRSPVFLRRRIARRFGIIGEEHKFNVAIDGVPITIADRDYFHKIQYLWCYGNDSDAEWYLKQCNSYGNQVEYQDSSLPCLEYGGEKWPIKGWIGTAKKAGDLKDREYDENLNKIIVMVRGRLAQEDILEDFAVGGVYSKYLMGEIHADFLDLDDSADIATSNRQEIIKGDPRYLELKAWVQEELRKVKRNWTKLRTEGGMKKALLIEPVRKWFDTLSRDQKKYAKTLFGHIDAMGVDDEGAQKELYKNGIIAFETLKVRENLAKLETISADNFEDFIKIFDIQDDIEAALYYQLVEGRLLIIEKFEGLVDENAKERTLQEYIYKNLWLLDPSWERGTENPRFEERITTEFNTINAALTEDERRGRVDIRYKEVAGKHVIVELKRYKESVDSNLLAVQVSKYKNALIKSITAAGERDYALDVICIIGKGCTNWINKDEERKARRSLEEQDIRVVYYDELIKDANSAYKKYLQKKEEVKDLMALLQEIDAMAPLEDTT